MTQYLGIITACGAVAVLAWLVCLLYPRLVPAAARYTVDHPWQQAGLFALAIAFSIAISRLQLFPDEDAFLALLNRIIILAPVLAYVVSRRSRAAVLIPRKQVLRSLLIGFAFALLGLAAFFLSAATADDPLAYVQGVQVSTTITILLRTMVHCVVAGAFLALVAAGWSIRTALTLAALAITATQIPGLLEDGFTAAWLGLLVTHIALVVGLLSAVLATRNIAWLWPVLAVLNLLQLNAG